MFKDTGVAARSLASFDLISYLIVKVILLISIYQKWANFILEIFLLYQLKLVFNKLVFIISYLFCGGIIVQQSSFLKTASLVKTVKHFEWTFLCLKQMERFCGSLFLIMA